MATTVGPAGPTFVPAREARKAWMFFTSSHSPAGGAPGRDHAWYTAVAVWIDMPCNTVVSIAAS